MMAPRDGNGRALPAEGAPPAGQPAAVAEGVPEAILVSVSSKAARAEERAALLPVPGFEECVEPRSPTRGGAPPAEAPPPARRRCCASRPASGWRVALAATAVWTLLALAAWAGIVVAAAHRGDRASTTAAMRRPNSGAQGGGAADLCDPLELQVCAGAQPWWAAGTIYQVYPRSFQDSDGDGVGDLRGILQRIDYIASLNVSAIWLSPVFPSPMRDFGYDVSDYENIHPLFGTLADLDALVDAAHARGLRVLLDLVPNHTSDVHPWFVESASSRTSPKRNWYVWVQPDAPADNATAAGPPGPPPNNWKSFFGGSAWSWDTNTRAWYLHQYLPSQPDLNWREPEVQAAFGDIMRFWQHRGIDGFRIDSLPTLLEHQALRDEPPNPEWREGMDPHDAQLHINYTQDVWPIHKLVRGLRAVADAGRSVLVCETRVRLHELARFYGPHLHECQLPFFFDLVDWSASWNATRLKTSIATYLGDLPRGAVPTWVLGNHDNPRVASRLGGVRQARAAMALLMTLPGTPTVYNGEELAMSDVALRDDQVRDPAALRQPRELWPVVGRDPERTPMQWDASRAAGFLPPGAPAEAQPWLPLAPDAQSNNVAAQERNATSPLSLFRTLATLRRGEPALRGAPLLTLDWGGNEDVPAAVVAFARPLRCACGNITTRGRAAAQLEPVDEPTASSPAPAPAPSLTPDAPPAPAPVPRFANATSFVFAMNMGTTPVTVNLAAAMGRAGIGADGWATPLTRVLDSDGVATRAAERVDSTAVQLAPWEAVILSVRLEAHPTNTMRDAGA